MKVAYPVFIKKDGDYDLVYIPDFDGMTEGFGFCDAIEMARDYIGLSGTAYYDEGKDYPIPSDEAKARETVKNRGEDEFVFSDGTLTFVDIDFDAYRKKIRNLSVKKNCTIPQWLAEKAVAANINFSRVLQDALIDIVGADA